MQAHHIIGHRGARHEAPENTLGGFKYLQNLGIQQVELDVHLSLDKALMVIHDTTTDRTTNTKGLVSQLSQAQLQSLNAVADFEPGWPQVEPVPTLTQVIESWADLTHMQIEVKPLDCQRQRDALISALVEFIQSAASTTAFVVTSSDERFLHQAQDHLFVPRGLVAEENHQDPLGTALSLGCQLLALHYSLYTPELAKKCQQAKMPVSLWTVNDLETAKTLIARGASTVITDYPKLFLDSLEKV